MDDNSSSGVKRLSSRGLSRAALNKLLVVFVVLAVLGLSSAGYFYHKLSNAKISLWGKNSPTAAQKGEQDAVAKLVAEVGKLMDLPANETPTVATVTDTAKLKDEPFFQKAKNGDKVLIYQNAKKVILYDPVAKKISNVGPFAMGTTGQSTASAQIAQSKIVIRNGTTVPALASKIEGVVKKALPEASIISKENASRTSFDKTIVVVINPALKDISEALAKVLGAYISDIPAGESKPPGADILIIVGKDKV